MLYFLNSQQPIFETGNQRRDVLRTLKTQTSMMAPFCKNNERLKTDNSFTKRALSYMFERILKVRLCNKVYSVANLGKTKP